MIVQVLVMVYVHILWYKLCRGKYKLKIKLLKHIYLIYWTHETEKRRKLIREKKIWRKKKKLFKDRELKIKIKVGSKKYHISEVKENSNQWLKREKMYIKYQSFWVLVTNFDF